MKEFLTGKTLKKRLYDILNDQSLDEESEEESKVELIEDLIDKSSWAELREHLFEVLLNSKNNAHWETVAQVFFGAALDDREIPAERLIALLHYRLRPSKGYENNLVWSITAEIKGLDYMSDYEPLDDPAIVNIIKRFEDM